MTIQIFLMSLFMSRLHYGFSAEPMFLKKSSSMAFVHPFRGSTTKKKNRIQSKNSNTKLFASIADTTADDQQILADELKRCNGEIIDTHLHIAPWFNTAEQLVDELESNNISIGLLYNPYTKMSLPFDLNTYIHGIASASDGKIYMLASLNATHDNWDEHRDEELERLATFLEKDELVLGCKLAPPHTCLLLQGPIMDDICATVAKSSKKLMGIHIGTTPFCGPLGEQFGIQCCCSEEYVNPMLLVNQIEKYPDVKFALLHSGHEFLPPDSPYFHNWKNVDRCIELAKKYPNVYLSISALFAQSPEGEMKYPGGDEVVRKMKQAGVCHKVFWGSDASYNQGQIRPVLISAIKAMIDGGWTEEERTWALNGCIRHVFNFPDKKQ